MNQATHNRIVSFIWGIADDVLRDLFKRGKYPDVILPMCVIRRMDAVLEPTKQKVLETKEMLDKAVITEQSAALCAAAGQACYSMSEFARHFFTPQPLPTLEEIDADILAIEKEADGLLGQTLEGAAR